MFQKSSLCIMLLFGDCLPSQNMKMSSSPASKIIQSCHTNGSKEWHFTKMDQKQMASSCIRILLLSEFCVFDSTKTQSDMFIGIARQSLFLMKSLFQVLFSFLLIFCFTVISRQRFIFSRKTKHLKAALFRLKFNLADLMNSKTRRVSRIRGGRKVQLLE